MNTSLIVLIVLIVVVLAVILATSETGKSTMTKMFNKKSIKSEKPQVQAKAIQAPKVAKPRKPVAKKAAPVVKASKPVAKKPVVKTAPTTGTLGGDLLSLFTPDTDDISEFGVTQATMDSLAEQYRKSHLIAAKESRIRHRSHRSSMVDEAEKKLQQSYMSMAREARHEYDPDFVSNTMRKNIISSGESVRSERGNRGKQFAPIGRQ